MRIPRESFLVFPTPSILYALLGEITYGLALALSIGVGDNGGFWRRRGLVCECDLHREEGGSVGVDVEEFPRPDINCRQYISSMEKCAHVLSAPVFSTPGMIRQRL